MGAFAVVENDQITGQCTHLVPAGSATSPMPFPFVAPLTEALVDTVLIMGRRAAVVGSSGGNRPPHPGLHPSDPFFETPGPPGAPRRQQGTITSGSATVFFGGKAAATVQSQASCCRPQPAGRIVPGIPTVQVG